MRSWLQVSLPPLPLSAPCVPQYLLHISTRPRSMAEYHHRTPAEEAVHRRGNMFAVGVVGLALATVRSGARRKSAQEGLHPGGCPLLCHPTLPQLAFAIAILVILSMDLMPSGECLFTTASQSVNVCQLSRARTCRCRCTPGGRAFPVL